MTHLLVFKTFAEFSLFLLTAIAGFLPLHFAAHNKKVLHLSDAFASGIFLGAALLHLLPDAEGGIAKIWGSNCYPIAQLLCAATFLLLLLMERGIVIFSKRKSRQQLEPLFACHHHHEHPHETTPAATLDIAAPKNLLTPYLLVLVLAIHSFVEGAAIGISTSFAAAFMIYFAVVVHKGSESMALASNLHRYTIPIRSITKIIFFFSLVTPLGILGASLIEHIVQMRAGEILEAVFNAVAAGTFLYLGTVHVSECENSFENFGEITALFLGAILMGVVAIWV